MSYQTPGVYVEEISTLPPSVAEVSTAVPTFFGCTERGPAIGRVDSLLDFEETFGGPRPETYVVTPNEDGSVDASSIDRTTGGFDFLLYYAVSHYFKNGGGACWIVSVGDYDAAPNKRRFEDGLALLAKEDEPTLIVLTDAVGLGPADYYDLCQQALGQCKALGDRFAVFDVRGGDVEAFREKIGTDGLMYGAAYHPYLRTSLTPDYDDGGVEVVIGSSTDADPETATLDSIQSTHTFLYQAIRAELGRRKMVLPPSAAVAGAYASVDRDRGVWKAPANISLKGVAAPVEKITHAQQGGLNID
ncbi:hypothetical protein AC249_AIPGENE1555, partial [Exaiptasia diaphana]